MSDYPSCSALVPPSTTANKAHLKTELKKKTQKNHNHPHIFKMSDMLLFLWNYSWSLWSGSRPEVSEWCKLATAVLSSLMPRPPEEKHKKRQRK